MERDRFTVAIDRNDVRRRPAGVYHIWTGLFTGWAPRWVNMAVSEAPADRRDTAGRIELATVIVE